MRIAQLYEGGVWCTSALVLCGSVVIRCVNIVLPVNVGHGCSDDDVGDVWGC